MLLPTWFFLLGSSLGAELSDCSQCGVQCTCGGWGGRVPLYWLGEQDGSDCIP